MTLPAAGAFTAGVQSSLSSWDDANEAWVNLNAALATMYEPVAELVMDTGSPDEPAGYTPGWGVLLDPQNCPTAYLPFLAMFIGASVPPGTDDADARTIITGEAGFSRGTPTAMVSAAQRFLTGTQSVTMIERTPDAYTVQMIMRPEQVINQTALQNAVLAVKPGGIIVDFVYTDAFLWLQAIHTWSADTMTWAATSTTQP